MDCTQNMWPNRVKIFNTVPLTNGAHPSRSRRGRANGPAPKWLLLPLSISAAVLPQTGAANSVAHAICDHVAQQAANERGVPLSVMRAITRTETGRSQNGRLTPWPWTVNMEGAGHWFDTRAEAEAYVATHHARGARSYDVGCFQINYRWHGQHFASVNAMFDPLTNARYAAKFLSELFEETGDWSAAAGAYHSRTPTFAQRYRARFDRIRARMETGADTPTVAVITRSTTNSSPVAAAPRINLYPLLQSGAPSTSLGSLVPNTEGARPALITLDASAKP